jgi:hypothetical protein
MERDMRSFTNTGKTVFFILLLLLVGLFLTSCPTDSLLGGDSDGGGSGTPTDTRERFTIGNVYNNAFPQLGDVSGDNKGLGQEIMYSEAYIPETFKVYIQDSGQFDSPPETNTFVNTTIQLRIWSDLVASPIVYGNASLLVSAGTTGEISFTIQDAIEIPANTKVRYALYIPDAVSLDVQGKLEANNNNNSYAAGSGIMTANRTDGQVLSASNWETTSAWDLAFSLTGILAN